MTVPASLTTQEFVARAREVHGDRYDYSLTLYISTKTKVVIGCPEHGDFEQVPNRHLSDGRGCPQCTQARVADKARLTTEEFVERAQEVHEGAYDYSMTTYTGARAKVRITCPEHGPFDVTATSHINKAVGCPECTRRRVSASMRTNPDEWLARLRSVLGEDRYDYRETKYVDRTTDVRVFCKEHGPFTRKPHRLISGTGCSECRRTSSQKAGGRSVRWTTEQFVGRAREIYGDRYDYSQVDYSTAWTKVTIVCAVHGPFQKAPVEHIHRGRGCAKCAHHDRARRSMQSTEDWVAKAKEVHGNAYGYSASEYNGAKVPVTVICHTHGAFMTHPEAHLRGSGCARCRQSLGERTVAAVLDQAGIQYLTEFTDPTLRSDRALRFDFALLDQRMLIEFDGEQHRRVVQWGNETPEEAARRFLGIVERDAMKTRWAAENGWRLIRLQEIDTVAEVLAGEGLFGA